MSSRQLLRLATAPRHRRCAVDAATVQAFASRPRTGAADDFADVASTSSSSRSQAGAGCDQDTQSFTWLASCAEINLAP